jgi:hypothetical protein
VAIFTFQVVAIFTFCIDFGYFIFLAFMDTEQPTLKRNCTLTQDLTPDALNFLINVNFVIILYEILILKFSWEIKGEKQENSCM